MPQPEPLIPLSTSDRAKRFSIHFALTLLLYGGALTLLYYFTDAYLSRPHNEAYPLPLILLCAPGLVILLLSPLLNRAWVAIIGLIVFGLYLVIAIFAAIAWLSISFGDGDFRPVMIAWNIGVVILCVGLGVLLVYYARCTRVSRVPGVNQHGFEPLPVVRIAANVPILNSISTTSALNPQIPPTPAADNQGK